jgi:large subunit ribosomal protein L13
VEKTYVVKGHPVNEWVLVDASNQGIGRLATKIAGLLMGKHKPTFTPGVMVGDNVVVINASQLKITQKRLDTKIYYHHSGYPSGLKSVGLAEQMRTHPDRVIRSAVWGMIPHTKIGKEIIKHLHIYAGSTHPHGGQFPKSDK